MFNFNLNFKAMRTLSIEKMENVEGGECDPLLAAGAVYLSALSWGLYFAGPAAWPAAIIAGAAIGTQCDKITALM